MHKLTRSAVGFAVAGLMALPAAATAQTFQVNGAVTSGGVITGSAGFNLAGGLGVSGAVGLSSASFTMHVGIATLYRPASAIAAPTGLIATAGDKQVDLLWNANTEADFDRYFIYQDGALVDSTGPSLPNDTTHTQTGLTNTTSYNFYVTAVNLAGVESAPSAPVSATPLAPAPAAPTGLMATASDLRVDLIWRANSESNIDHYNIYQGLTGEVLDFIASTAAGSPNDTTYTSGSLTNNTAYDYYITASNNEGTVSVSSDTVNATPVPPAAAPNVASLYLLGHESFAVAYDDPPVEPGAAPAQLRITDNTMTVEAWIYLIDLAVVGDTSIIAARPSFGSQAPYSYALRLVRVGADVKAEFLIGGTGANGEAKVTGATTINPTEWTHIAGSYDGATIVIYVNSVSDGDVAVNYNLDGGNLGLFVGGHDLQGDPAYEFYPFFGIIDELRLWADGKNNIELLDGMSKTLIGNEPGLLGYWPLDAEASFAGVEQSVAVDLTANKNHLLLGYDFAEIISTYAQQTVSIPPRIIAEDYVATAEQPFSTELIVRGHPPSSVTLNPGDILPAGLTQNGTLIEWLPTSAQFGRFFFEVWASNGVGNDTAYFDIWVNQVPVASGDHANNEARLSILNNGILGGGSEWRTGGGFGFGAGDPNALLEGTLVIAQSATQVSGELDAGPVYHEFAPRSGINGPATLPPGFETGIEVIYDDLKSYDPIGVTVRQTSISKSSSPDNDYVIVRYDVENRSNAALSGINIGLAMEWDLGDASNNLGGFNQNLRLNYMFEDQIGVNFYGVALLGGPLGGQAVGDVDLFSDAGLFASMTTSTNEGNVAGDLRTMMSAGPFDIPVSGVASATFAVLAGATLNDLEANAQAAHQMYNSLTTEFIRTKIASNITSSSADLSADVKTSDRAWTVGFAVIASGTTDTLVVAGNPADIAAYSLTTSSATITGLTPGATYDFRAVALDNGMRTAVGFRRSFTTPTDPTAVVDLQEVTGDGKVTYPNAGVTMDFTFSSGAGGDTVEVVAFSSEPDGTPPAQHTILGGQYWEFNFSGTGVFTVEFTLFFAPGTFTVADLADLSTIALIRRESGGTGTWEPLGIAQSATDSSVTFAGIIGFSQFAVSRIEPLDEEAPVISLQSTTPSIPQLGTDLVVNVTVSDNDAVDFVDLYVAKGNSSTFSTSRMSFDGGNSFSSTILGSAITLEGLVSFVRAVDMSGNSDSTAKVFIGTRFTAEDAIGTASIPGNPYVGGFPQEKWLMISVPATLADASTAVHFEELGQRDDTQWRMFAVQNQNYIENPSSLKAGDGYWLYQRVTPSMEFVLDAGRTNGMAAQTKSLAPGWHLIGNPYAFTVDIVAPASDFYGPLTYNGTSWSAVNQTVVPWQGYAIYRRGTTAGDISFVVPTLNKGILAKEAERLAGWQLNLTAQGQTYGDVNTFIGRLEGATEGYDSFDNPEPPYIEDYIYLAMDRTDLDENLPLLTTDIRSLQEENGEWNMALYTRGETGPIALTSEISGDLPGGAEIRLIDLQKREVHNLTHGFGPILIRDYTDMFPYRFTLLAGSAAFVEQAGADVLAALPSEFGLANNYPNPFNPATRIPFTLTHPARVSLVIYNLLGQEVVTLINGWEDLGSHEVIWNGLNRVGQPVASGLYFAVYRAQGRIYTRKMMLMR